MDTQKTNSDQILIIDDDADLCNLLVKNLSRAGYVTNIASCGKQAIEMINVNLPLLIITDYRLSDITGAEVMKILMDRQQYIPFIMMTGQGDERLAVEMMKLGAADYLIKDTELISRIPSVVERVINTVKMKARLSKAEEELRLASKVFAHSYQGILITNRSGVILDVNPAFETITGFLREEALGQNPRFLNSGKQSREFYEAMWGTLLAKGNWHGEVQNRRKDGSIYTELLNISTVFDDRGEIQYYIALFSDISDVKEYQSQLERIAHYDSLTGLPNRLLLADRLMHAIAQVPRHGKYLVIVYLDLDGFKEINDKYGHETGDILLASLAARMTQALREGDTLARLGGDEFVAVLTDLIDTKAGRPILQRLLDAAAHPVSVNGLQLQVSASLGVTVYPQNEDVDADQLLRQADQAMYHAKQSGKNRYHVFDAEQDRNVRGRYEHLKQIEQALLDKEFVLYYQPKVNMRTGDLIGAEALIRWKHKERGILPPAAFLPVIEDHPLSIALGEWVIETALEQIEVWHQQGFSIPISVNISALQLQHPQFVLRLQALLECHPSVVAGELELEILETSALEDITIVTQVINACKDFGVGFALDDFGTGYSSLSYLKFLPAGLIKIDQSFVREMLEDTEDLIILEGIVGLASAFRRRLIAEGVETEEHGEILLRMGCQWAQGYAIARPLPPEDFISWRSTWESPQSWKNVQEMPKERFPALFAAIDHKATFSSIQKLLLDERATEVIEKVSHCHIDLWMDDAVRASFFDAKSKETFEAVHKEFHELATTLCAQHSSGNAQEARQRIGELHVLSEALLAQLRSLY